jgi:hypothetical protein
MRIKKLFKTESEFLDYAWSFINFDENKIWREEDLPKLQLFIDYKDRLLEPSAIDRAALRESMDYYDKCMEEYAGELFEIADDIVQFSNAELAEFFLLEPIEEDQCWDYDSEGNEIDEDGNIIPPLSRESLKISSDFVSEMSFPLYFVGHINSDSDRLGKIRLCYSEFVSLKDFEK